MAIPRFTLKKIFFTAIEVILLLVLFSCGDNISLNSPNGLVVIIKADDLGDTTPNWNRFMKMVVDKQINAGVGIIAKKVTKSGSITEIQRVSNILQDNKFPVIEFWNHGYDHSKINGVEEFMRTADNFQFEHIQLAQNFFVQNFHFTAHTFSAPFNKTSKETLSVLSHFPEINVWMCYQKLETEYSKDWKDPNQKVIHLYDKHIILNVDYLYVHDFPADKIIDNYNEDKNKPYILIQIHPAGWTDEDFNEFEQLIHFYKDSNRAMFMTPYQYYQYLHKNLTPND